MNFSLEILALEIFEFVIIDSILSGRINEIKIHITLYILDI